MYFSPDDCVLNDVINHNYDFSEEEGKGNIHPQMLIESLFSCKVYVWFRSFSFYTLTLMHIVIV